MTTQLSWQKSSYSGEGNNCLELASTESGALLIRESDSPTAIIETTPAKLATLLAATRDGRLA